MILTTDATGSIELREVYNGLLFVTNSGNRYGIAMRDDTIEVVVAPGCPEPRIFRSPRYVVEGPSGGIGNSMWAIRDKAHRNRHVATRLKSKADAERIAAIFEQQEADNG